MASDNCCDDLCASEFCGRMSGSEPGPTSLRQCATAFNAISGDSWVSDVISSSSSIELQWNEWKWKWVLTRVHLVPKPRAMKKCMRNYKFYGIKNEFLKQTWIHLKWIWISQVLPVNWRSVMWRREKPEELIEAVEDQIYKGEEIFSTRKSTIFELMGKVGRKKVAVVLLMLPILIPTAINS